MNLKARRIFLIFLIFVFTVISPLLILYSLGYKYNWQKSRVEKTGVFFIKSYPKNSQIYINNDLYKNETPTQITRLLPKIYEVKITKDGYASWVKNLSIIPQQTTFIEDVSLIKNKLVPESLLNGEFSNFLVSPNSNLIAFVETNNKGSIVWNYNLLNEHFVKIYEAKYKTQLEILSWSFTNKKLIIKEGLNYILLNTANPNNPVKISSISKYTYNDLKWNKLNDNLLYGKTNNTLFEIDIIQQKTTKISNEYIVNFYPYQNNLIYITKEKGAYYLKNNIQKPETIFSLPFSDEYEFSVTKTNQIILFDKKQKLIYIINPEDENHPITSSIKNIEDYKWHDKQMIHWNNSELWVYYPESGEKILLERTSQNIKNAFWHPNSVYVFAVIGDKLKLYELDSRDKRNTYDLIDINEGQENYITSNKKGNYLYLITEVNNKPGFYQVEMQ